MLLLVTQAIPQMHEYDHPDLGRLLTPRHCCSLTESAPWPWAADNDCFRGFKPAAYVRMLDRLATAHAGCLFVTVPDVVGDAVATARLFEVWWPAAARRGLPAALVAQDGLEQLQGWLTGVWPRIDALLIGASTEWKLGTHAGRLVGTAHQHDKCVHMGRVNSARRMRYAASIGCDSVDALRLGALASREPRARPTRHRDTRTAVARRLPVSIPGGQIIPNQTRLLQQRRRSQLARSRLLHRLERVIFGQLPTLDRWPRFAALVPRRACL